ncbi:hypothetical protein [Clostridium transplantifaecale]|uniref:hypothetical protein n=1 Tax=Clostridium transplantifaecale TaxID=2479838 RepID=UPI0013DE4229|nr:hypothetical protein [Clostridium transplantifaecale]
MRNIIIISKNDELLNQLTTMLARAGYSHVYSSSDCTKILSLAYRLNPKLIIIDMELPPVIFNDLFKLFSQPMKKIMLFIAPHRDIDPNLLRLIKKGYSHFVIHPINERLLINQVKEIMNQDNS